MQHRLRSTEKADAFCITIISWQDEGKAPIFITEVYHGPDEYSSSGPFFSCNYRWELYKNSSDYRLFVWHYKTCNGSTEEEHENFEIYRGINDGQSWEKILSLTPRSLIAKK